MTIRPHRALSTWWWAVLCGVGVGGIALIIAAWAGSENPDDLSAINAAIALIAVVAAGFAVLKTWPQFDEWRREHQRFADFKLWIELAQDPHRPGTEMAAVSHEDALPRDPMFKMEQDSAIVRACVEVNDRFPLRDCILNIVVPSEWAIFPQGEGTDHRQYPTVTPNPRVKPAGDHGCRFTVRTGTFSPNSHMTAVAEIRPPIGSSDAVRVMVELSCTPAPKDDASRFRFALVAPREQW